jgi:protein ImuB
VQSKWRVACVRIPRFPIGAVWQHAIAEGIRSIPRTGASQERQLSLTMSPNSNGTAERFPANGDLPKPGPGRMDSSFGKGESTSRNEKLQNRHWDDLPIALSEGTRVRAVTSAGARLQVRAGMTVTEAQSRCADLEVLPWDQVVIDQAVRGATAAFFCASPQVTPVVNSPGLWWIGASGLDTLGGEATLAVALHNLARQWHPGSRVAIADSCVAARAGTWEPPPSIVNRQSSIANRQSSVTIVPPGADAAYLATAPIGLIPMDESMAEAMTALGIRVAGGLAALPPDDVEQRWGRDGLTSWRLARGEDRRRPGLATTEFPRTATADLTPSVETMEPVLFLLRAALERLLVGLAADGRAAATLAITLTLDDVRGAGTSAPAHTITREVRLAHPMARLVPLFERCRALLDRWTLPAPVCGVTVAIVATAPLAGEQGDLLDPSWRDPAAADAAFARLRAELGSDAIVVPVVADSHRPERAGTWVALGEGVEQRKAQSAKEKPHDLPVSSCTRLLESPEPVDVECTNGQPRVLWWRGRRMRIEHPAGPERLAGDWWKDQYARDYWRCEDPDGEGTLVLYHDYSQACLSSGSAWFVQGWYD